MNKLLPCFGVALVSILFTLFLVTPSFAEFNFKPSTILVEEIKPGGPPKDGIPALLKPKFVSASQATYLTDKDRVIGFKSGKDVRAYPISIMTWHEIVNDKVNGRPIVVSYCPLCGTAMTFESELEGKTYTFGVSGLLYRSDVLMYDHQTESLWSQIKMEAVTGEMAGTGLRLLATEVTTWKDWKSRYPGTKVLSQDTGYNRNYGDDPYEGYDKTDQIYFPVGELDRRFHPKSWVFGIRVGKKSKAYPFDELRTAENPVVDEFAGRAIKVYFDRKNRSARAETQSGVPIPGVAAFWFAWKAFHPNTDVYTATK